MSRVSDIKGNEEEDPTPFQVYDLESIEDLKDPEPLIQDVLTRGCVALLFGEYGTAKSFLALDWAAHLAKGIDWFGHVITGEHNVLYVAAEGASGLKKRLKAWTMEYGTIPFDNFHLTRVAVRFGNDDTHYEHLSKLIKEHEYDFIVIDTLSRNTPGMDENGPEMSEFIEKVFQLRDAHSTEKTAFLIVHHAGKDKSKGSRGWSGLPGATDFSYRLSKGSDILNVFTLAVDRTKDAEPLGEMSFTLKVHVTDKEWGRTSCTLALDDYEPQQGGYSSQQLPPNPNVFAPDSDYAKKLQDKVDSAPWNQDPTPWSKDDVALELAKKDRPKGRGRRRL